MRLALCLCFARGSNTDEESSDNTDGERETKHEDTNNDRSNPNATVFYSAQQSFIPLLLSSNANLDDENTMLRSIQEQEEEVPPVPATPPPEAAGKKRRSPSLANTFLFKRQLENKDDTVVKVLDLPNGYPSHLTKEQLQTCITFRKKLRDEKTQHPLHYEMVYYFVDIEGEAYAICRYLRSRKFNLEDTMILIRDRVDIWKHGRAHDFYPSASLAIGGAPESAFLTQFPLVLGDIAKNGCPVCYFPVEQISIEGIECTCAMEDIHNYVWYFAVHKIRRLIAAAQAKDPTLFIRMQIILLVDLKGLAIGTLRRAMDALEKAMQILSVFPEFLFSVCVINTPRFFGAFWPLIKAFMDPQSAKKFELYSSPSVATKRLLELVDEKNLASDFGGGAKSTASIVATQGENNSSGGENVSRQITKLLTKKRNKDVETAIELHSRESASISVYTKAEDGAEVVLYKNKKDEMKKLQLTRSENERAEKPFFRSFGEDTLIRGPGTFRVVVKRPSNPATDYYLLQADVSKVDG